MRYCSQSNRSAQQQCLLTKWIDVGHLILRWEDSPRQASYDYLKSKSLWFLALIRQPILWCLQWRYCFVLLQTTQSFFFVSRSVWIVIENNYPALCSDNAHFFHQHSASYRFTAAPNQPQQLQKFLFTVVWTFRLIQINIHAHLTRRWDNLIRTPEQFLRKIPIQLGLKAF